MATAAGGREWWLWKDGCDFDGFCGDDQIPPSFFDITQLTSKECNPWMHHFPRLARHVRFAGTGPARMTWENDWAVNSFCTISTNPPPRMSFLWLRWVMGIKRCDLGWGRM